MKKIIDRTCSRWIRRWGHKTTGEGPGPGEKIYAPELLRDLIEEIESSGIDIMRQSIDEIDCLRTAMGG